MNACGPNCSQDCVDRGHRPLRNKSKRVSSIARVNQARADRNLARGHAERRISQGFVLCACNAVMIEFHGWQSDYAFHGHSVEDCDTTLCEDLLQETS